MLGVAIALIPSVPVLAFYVPLRMAAARERRHLQRLWAAHGDDEEFRRFLAHRALFTLPYPDAQLAGTRPWQDYLDGHVDGLVALELRRRGLTSEGRAPR